MNFTKLAWERWKIIGHVNGEYIGRFTATLFYYTILVPFALGAQALVDPLKLRRPVAWVPRKPVSAALKDAQDQF